MSPARPLEVGITLGGMTGGAEWERALARVERAERLGFHSVWIPEMHFGPGATPAPMLMLAALAARTRRVRLATTSLLLTVHPPERVAEDAATLDHLSGGRVWLGLGRGFRAPLFRAFGIEPGTKRDRFDAALDTILERWRNGGPRPLQEPHPPLLVAAFGRKGLLQAARRGLPYLASPLESMEVLAENLAFHAENLPDGVDPSALRVPVIRTLHVAADDHEARRVLTELERETRRLAGSLPAALERSAGGDLVDRVIVGTVAQVCDTLGVYRERIGLDLLIARGGVPGVSGAEVEASLERLVGEVTPQLDP